MPHQYDITLLTDHRYLHPENPDGYTQNVLLEDQLVQNALEQQGLRVTRINWDAKKFDWTKTRFALFRTTWDYFDRFPEFDQWLTKTSTLTQFINPAQMLRWNMDKHYLLDLAQKGIPIPPTRFIETGETRALAALVSETGWPELILKPAISGAARHTYRLTPENAHEKETIFRELIARESMMLQEFQHQILSKGEIALMLFGGKFSHAILKRAKPGDFRVQDDFGGTVHDFEPDPQTIQLAEKALQACAETPSYARVDLFWDNQDQLVLSELELIEPELWFRKSATAAQQFAQVIVTQYFS